MHHVVCCASLMLSNHRPGHSSAISKSSSLCCELAWCISTESFFLFFVHCRRDISITFPEDLYYNETSPFTASHVCFISVEESSFVLVRRVCAVALKFEHTKGRCCNLWSVFVCAHLFSPCRVTQVWLVWSDPPVSKERKETEACPGPRVLPVARATV